MKFRNKHQANAHKYTHIKAFICRCAYARQVLADTRNCCQRSLLFYFLSLPCSSKSLLLDRHLSLTPVRGHERSRANLFSSKNEASTEMNGRCNFHQCSEFFQFLSNTAFEIREQMLLRVAKCTFSWFLVCAVDRRIEARARTTKTV